MLLTEPLTSDDESDTKDTILAKARFHRVLAKSLNKRLRRERQVKKTNEVIDVIDEMKKARILNLNKERRPIEEKTKKQSIEEKTRGQGHGKKEKIKDEKGSGKLKSKNKKKTIKGHTTKKDINKIEQNNDDCSTDTDFKYWFSVGYVDHHKRQATKKDKAKKKNKTKKKKTKKSKGPRDVKGSSKEKKVMKDPILEDAKAEIEAAEGSYNDTDLTETTAYSSIGSLQQYFNMTRKIVNEDETSELTTDHSRVSWQHCQSTNDVSPRRPTRYLDLNTMSAPFLKTESNHSRTYLKQSQSIHNVSPRPANRCHNNITMSAPILKTESNHSRTYLKQSQCKQDVSPRPPPKPMSLSVILANERDCSDESSDTEYDEYTYEGTEFDEYTYEGTEYDEYTYEGTVSDDEMLDDLTEILEESEHYVRFKKKRPTRWDSISEGSVAVDTGLDEPLMTPMRTITTGSVGNCIPEDEEVKLTPQPKRKIITKIFYDPDQQELEHTTMRANDREKEEQETSPSVASCPKKQDPEGTYLYRHSDHSRSSHSRTNRSIRIGMDGLCYPQENSQSLEDIFDKELTSLSNHRRVKQNDKVVEICNEPFHMSCAF